MTAVTSSAPVRLAAEQRYRLRSDATLDSGPDGTLTLRQSRFELSLPDAGVARRALVLRLSDGWASTVELHRAVAALQGEASILRAQLLLRWLAEHSWLERRWQLGDRRLLDVLPVGLGAAGQVPTRKHRPGTRYRLSRLCALRPVDGVLTATAAAGPRRIGCTGRLVAALCAAAETDGCDRARLAGMLGVDEATAGTVLDELLTAEVLLPAEQADRQAGEPPAAYWSATELDFHDRSRPGRHTSPVGGTYRWRGVTAVPPLRHRYPYATAVALPTPTGGGSRPLAELVRTRRSIRRYDERRPLELAALGEFLYRTQHTRSIGTLGGQELGARPYPTGGGVCALEVYPVVVSCVGVDAGLYHYVAVAHRLERLAGLGAGAAPLLSYARAAARLTGAPQVLLVLTARIPRLMWKYEGMGYALALKDVGVLTELMYLVAADMGLAPCALGAGDSTAFARWSGIDPLAEPAVGDFLLGSSARTEAQP